MSWAILGSVTQDHPRANRHSVCTQFAMFTAAAAAEGNSLILATRIAIAAAAAAVRATCVDHYKEIRPNRASRTRAYTTSM